MAVETEAKIKFIGDVSNATAATNQIKGGLSGIKQAAQSAGTELKKVGAALTGAKTGTQLTAAQRAAEQLGKELGTTAQKATVAERRLKELRAAGVSAAEAQRILSKELGLTSDQFELLNSRLDRITQGMTVLAGAATATAGAITVAFKSSFDQFVEFDQAISQSRIISGSTAAEIKGLDTEVRSLGASTSKSAVEIAQTTVSLSRAGFTAQETTAALAGIVKGSEATGESLETLGDISAKTVRTFGLAAGQTQDVVDALVTTANATNTTVNGLGESLAYVGATAASSDQDLNKLLTVIGLLGDAGIQGSQAGTSLTAALNQLKTASAASASEFPELARGSKKLVAAFNKVGVSVRNSDGSMKDLIDIIPDLKASFAGLSQEDQDILSKTLFGVQGGNALLTLLNVTDERLAQVTGSMEGFRGASQRASDEIAKTAEGSLRLFESALAGIQLEAGEFVAQGAIPLVNAATALLGTFNKLPPELKVVVFGLTGMTGVLSAAAAVAIAYQIAVQSAVVSNTLLAASQLKATITSTKLGVALTGSAFSAGTYAAAMKGAAIATAGAAKALLAFITSAAGIAAIGAAAAVVGFIAADALRASKNLEEAAIQLESFARADTALARVVDANGKLIGTNNIQVAQSLSNLNKKRAEGVQLSDEEEARQQKLIRRAEQELKYIDANIKARQQEIEFKRRSTAFDDEAARAQERENQTAIKTLELERKALEKQLNAARASTQAKREQTAAQKGLNDAEKEAIKEELQKQKEEEDSAASKKAEEGRRARSEAFQENLQNIQKDNQKEIDALREESEKRVSQFQRGERVRLEDEIRSQQKTFDKEQAEFKKQAEREIQTLQADFQREQQQAKKDFEASLNRDQQAFDQAQDKVKQQVERQLQIDAADTRADKKALEEQFKEEDKQAEDLAKRKAELEAKFIREQGDPLQEEVDESPLEKRAREFAETQNQKRLEFQEQENQAQLAFEESVLQPKREELEEALELARLEFERNVLEPLRLNSEQKIAEFRRTEEAVIAEQRETQETALQQMRKEFEDSERLIRETEQQAREEREAKFKAAQRQLDLIGAEATAQITIDAAQKAKEILESVDIGSGITARMSGGPVSPGSLYLGGEAGPELLKSSGKSQLIGMNGPELFKVSQAGYVVPNNQLNSQVASLAGQVGSINSNLIALVAAANLKTNPNFQINNNQTVQGLDVASIKTAIQRLSLF